MTNNQMCPQCGCKEYHYSPSRGAMVCNQCGNSLQSDIQMEEDMNYDQAVRLATAHLRVENWEQTKQLIRPLCTNRPTDKKLYLILLAATTNNYENFLFDDDARRKEAYGYWEKLSRLHCVNRTMREYACRRAEVAEENRKSKLRLVGIYIGICLVIAIIILLGSNSGFFHFIAIVGAIVIIEKIIVEFNVVNLLKKAEKKPNPFS